MIESIVVRVRLGTFARVLRKACYGRCMRKIVGLVAAMAFLAGCDHIIGPSVTGSGKVVSETRTTDKWNKVEIQGSANVVVDCGSDGPIKLEGDDNILPLISTKVKDGVLVISSDKSYSTHNVIKVHLNTRELSAASLSGSGDVAIHGASGKSLALQLSGSGNFDGDGTVDELSANLSGSGEFRLSKLKAGEAAVSIAGSGSADVFCTGTLDASIAGSGSVTYSGHPTDVKKNVSGSGEVVGK